MLNFELFPSGGRIVMEPSSHDGIDAMHRGLQALTHLIVGA